MQMTKNATVLLLTVIVATATLALTSFRSNQAWAIMKESVFTGSPEQHMNQSNHMNFNGNLTTHMNMPGYMSESMLRECEDLHAPQNETECMMGSH